MPAPLRRPSRLVTVLGVALVAVSGPPAASAAASG
jgi:hypothetical protein